MWPYTDEELEFLNNQKQAGNAGFFHVRVVGVLTTQINRYREEVFYVWTSTNGKDNC